MSQPSPKSTSEVVETTVDLKANGDSEAPPTAFAPNPNIKLPPAALRLGSRLEYDVLGTPYYKFPPFLSPPDGIELIPFNKFQPVGIEIIFDPDEEEFDGAGIPTVMLGTKHVPLSERDLERKKKKRKKKDEGSQAMRIPRRDTMWWEDWADGEDLRRAEPENPALPREERFISGAHEFARGRKMNPSTQSVYDKFRQYVGLMSKPRGPRFGKRDRRKQPEEEEDEDEDDEDEFESEVVHEEQQDEQEKAINHRPDPDADAWAADVMAESERRETRMNIFLNDPERSMLIFFSSWWTDRGLGWDRKKCRDGPKLLQFFFQFFIRNRLMPDYLRQFKAALQVCDIAVEEFLLFSKFGTPGKLSEACTELWGTRDPFYHPPGSPVIKPEEPPEPAPPSNPALEDFERSLREQGTQHIDLSSLPHPPDPKNVAQTVWGNSEFNSNWGNFANSESGVPKNEEDTWGWGTTEPFIVEPDPSGWVRRKYANLMELFGGPTSVPLKYAPTLTERSTRYIMDIVEPDPKAPPGSIRATFAIMKMAPWKIPEGSKDISPPEIVKREGIAEGKNEDTTKAILPVLIEKEEVKNLKIGMGSHGLWVRVNLLPEDNEEEGEKGAAGGGEQKKRKRGKGKGKDKKEDDIDREWWYHEVNYGTLTSFYLEPRPDEIVEGT